MAYNKNKFDKPYISLPSIDEKNILELFNLSNQMDSQEILQFSMIKQIPLYLCNDSNKNNLIHNILQNDNKKSEGIRLNLIKFLVNNQVNPDQVNKYNKTPLHIACSKQYHDICSYLIKDCNVNVNYKDDNGFTPLHYLLNGNTEIIENNNVRELIQPKKPDNVFNNEIKEIKKQIWNEIKGNPFFSILKNTIDNYIEDMKEEQDQLESDISLEYANSEQPLSNTLTQSLYDKIINSKDKSGLVIKKELILGYSKKIDTKIKELFKNFDISEERINTEDYEYKNELKNLIKTSCDEFQSYIQEQFTGNKKIQEDNMLKLYSEEFPENIDKYTIMGKKQYLIPQQNRQDWTRVHSEMLHPNSRSFTDNVIDLNNQTFIGGSKYINAGGINILIDNGLQLLTPNIIRITDNTDALDNQNFKNMFDEIWILLYGDTKDRLINSCNTIYENYDMCVSKLFNIHTRYTQTPPLPPSKSVLSDDLLPQNIFDVNNNRLPLKIQKGVPGQNSKDTEFYENYHPAIKLKLSNDDIEQFYNEVFDKLYSIISEQDSNIYYVTSRLINKPVRETGNMANIPANFLIPYRNTNLIPAQDTFNTAHPQSIINDEYTRLDNILTNMRGAGNNTVNINTQATNIERIIGLIKTNYFSNNRQYINLEKISNLLKKFDYYKILPESGLQFFHDTLREVVEQLYYLTEEILNIEKTYISLLDYYKYKKDIEDTDKHLEIYNEYLKFSDNKIINYKALKFFSCMFNKQYSYNTYIRLIYFDKIIYKNTNGNNQNIILTILYNSYVDNINNLRPENSNITQADINDIYQINSVLNINKINDLITNNRYLPKKKLYDLIYFLQELSSGTYEYLTNYINIIRSPLRKNMNDIYNNIIQEESSKYTKMSKLLKLKLAPSINSLHNVIDTDSETNSDYTRNSFIKFLEAFHLGLSYNGLVPTFTNNLMITNDGDNNILNNVFLVSKEKKNNIYFNDSDYLHFVCPFNYITSYKDVKEKINDALILLNTINANPTTYSFHKILYNGMDNTNKIKLNNYINSINVELFEKNNKVIKIRTINVPSTKVFIESFIYVNNIIDYIIDNGVQLAVNPINRGDIIAPGTRNVPGGAPYVASNTTAVAMRANEANYIIIVLNELIIRANLKKPQHYNNQEVIDAAQFLVSLNFIQQAQATVISVPVNSELDFANHNLAATTAITEIIPNLIIGALRTIDSITNVCNEVAALVLGRVGRAVDIENKIIEVQPIAVQILNNLQITQAAFNLIINNAGQAIGQFANAAIGIFNGLVPGGPIAGNIRAQNPLIPQIVRQIILNNKVNEIIVNIKKIIEYAYSSATIISQINNKVVEINLKTEFNDFFYNKVDAYKYFNDQQIAPQIVVNSYIKSFEYVKDYMKTIFEVEFALKNRLKRMTYNNNQDYTYIDDASDYRPPFKGSIKIFYEKQINKYYNLLKLLLKDNKKSYYNFIEKLKREKKISDISEYLGEDYKQIIKINNILKKLIGEYNNLEIEKDVITSNDIIDISKITDFINKINGFIFLYYYLKRANDNDPIKLPQFIYNKLSENYNRNYIIQNITNAQNPVTEINLDELPNLVGGGPDIYDTRIKSAIDTTYNITNDFNIDMPELFNLFIEMSYKPHNNTYNIPTNNRTYLPPSIEPVLYNFFECNKLKIIEQLLDSKILIPIKKLISNKGILFNKNDTDIDNLYLAKIVDELFKNQGEIILQDSITKHIMSLLEINDTTKGEFKEMFNNTFLNVSDDTLLSYSKINFNDDNDELDDEFLKNKYMFLNEHKKTVEIFKIYPFDYSNLTLLKQYYGLNINNDIIKLLIKNKASLSELDNELNPCVTALFKNKHYLSLEYLTNNLNINLKDFNFNEKIILQIKNESLNHINKLLNNSSDYIKIFKEFVNPQYENIINIMSINQNFGFNIINYVQESFYMCFYLINEYITDNLLNFENNSDKTDVLSKINLTTSNFEDNYLFKLYSSGREYFPSDRKELIVINYINYKIDEINKNINKIKKNIVSRKPYKNSVINNIIIKDIYIINTNLKKGMIDIKIINDLNAELKSINIKEEVDPEDEPYIKLRNPVKKKPQIIEEYNFRFKDSCYICYWLKLFKDEASLKKSTNLSLINILLKEQDDLLNNNNNYNDINTINKFWAQTKILCDEYFDNSKYTKKNKSLSFINYVLKHLTENIICFNIEFILRDLLYKYLIVKTDNITKINQHIDFILVSTYIKPGKSFIDILYQELPSLFVKNSVLIYEDSEDKLVFEPQPIKEILNELFNLLPLDNNVEFITILTKNLADYIDSFVPTLITNWYVVLENTFKFCINHYRLNSINKLLYEQYNPVPTTTPPPATPPPTITPATVLTKPTSSIKPWRNKDSNILYIALVIDENSGIGNVIKQIANHLPFQTKFELNDKLTSPHITLLQLYIPDNSLIDKKILNHLNSYAKIFNKIFNDHIKSRLKANTFQILGDFITLIINTTQIIKSSHRNFYIDIIKYIFDKILSTDTSKIIETYKITRKTPPEIEGFTHYSITGKAPIDESEMCLSSYDTYWEPYISVLKSKDSSKRDALNADLGGNTYDIKLSEFNYFYVGYKNNNIYRRL